MEKIVQHVVRPGDPAHVVLTKRYLLWFCIPGLLMSLLQVATLSDWGTLFAWSSVSLSVGSLGTLAYILILKRVNPGLMAYFVTLMTIGVVMLDLYSASRDVTRDWPIFVVILDLLLVCGMGHRFDLYLVIIVNAWLVLTGLESIIRFGLYDIPGTSSKEDRLEICDNPPCQQDAFHIFAPVLGMFIFNLDFYFTRGFAQRLNQKKKKMEVSIDVANRVARSLAEFDLQTAGSTLQQYSNDLPNEMFTAFHDILTNLHAYRPFLPDALFDAQNLTASSVPGLDTKTAAIVFTDIQGSTATWEACADGMREAMKVHDTTLRGLISEYHGYEVKTIGDSFMIAFENVYDAVCCGLDMQEYLVEADWPKLLTDMEKFAWKEPGPWCGLRIRIGIHSGPVTVQLNTLTNRYDYFGTTVNKAARLEGACIPGCLAVSPEAYQGIGTFKEVLSLPMGTTNLKGIGEVSPMLLLPMSLQGRAESVLHAVGERGDISHTFEDENESEISEITSVRNSSTDSYATSLSFTNVLHTMSETVGSVAKVTIQVPTFTALGEQLGRMIVASDRTNGVVLSLQGSDLIVVWNTSRRCEGHVNLSLHFATSAVKYETPCTVGLSNGRMTYGRVAGGTRQQFITAVAPCVNICSLLCVTAMKIRARCLYAPTASQGPINDFSPLCEWSYLDTFVTVYIPRPRRSVVTAVQNLPLKRERLNSLATFFLSES